MTTALVLAAHGAHDGSAANYRLRRAAEQLRQSANFDEVVAAFNLGTPHFSAVLDELTATDVTVVPVMTSSGYFLERLLPRELARNERFTELAVRITPPVGTHRALGDLFVRRVAQALDEFALSPSETTVVVVGHGTLKHDRSRAATDTLRDAIARAEPQITACSAFLDQPPYLQDLPATLTRAHVVVVPFLFGGGGHQQQDIPERLGLNETLSGDLPQRRTHADRAYIFTPPFGDEPELLDIVRDLATHGEATEVLQP